MKQSLTKFIPLIALLLLIACRPYLPHDIDPDPGGTPGCTKVSDETEAARLIAKVSREQSLPDDKYFHYLAYNCGLRYDLVRFQIRPDANVVIYDGGEWHYIDRQSGRVVYSYYEG